MDCKPNRGVGAVRISEYAAFQRDIATSNIHMEDPIYPKRAVMADLKSFLVV